MCPLAVYPWSFHIYLGIFKLLEMLEALSSYCASDFQTVFDIIIVAMANNKWHPEVRDSFVFICIMRRVSYSMEVMRVNFIMKITTYCLLLT